ncbi:MAG: M20 family metallo-hydrolase [Thermoplasmata archaeon]
MKEAILSAAESLRGESIELMRRLVAIPAIAPENGGDGEYTKAKFLVNYLDKLGFDELNWYDAKDVRVSNNYRPNLVAKVYGRNRERTIWFISHLDIVPPGDLSKWETPPYQCTEKEGKLYGRGTEDNGQAIVSTIMAARILKNLNLEPEYNMGLVFAADEEQGSKYGLKFLASQGIFSPQDMAVVPDYGNSDGSVIEVAEKSILWLKFSILGKQTHGSRPDTGINAHRAGAYLICALDRGLKRKFNARNKIFQPSTSTFEVTKKEANVPNVNTIPGQDIFYFDMRILPEYKPEDVVAYVNTQCRKIQKKFGVKVSVEVVNEEPAAPPTSPETEVYVRLANAITELRGIKPRPVGVGGGTCAAILRKQGIPSVVWETLDERAHEVNEYAWIKNILGDAAVFARMML